MCMLKFTPCVSDTVVYVSEMLLIQSLLVTRRSAILLAILDGNHYWEMGDNGGI